MALPATDSFTNSNGTQLTTHNSSWTLNDGDLDIQSNALAVDDSAASEYGVAHWNADTFDDDHYAEATIDALSSAVYIGVSVRVHASAETWYDLETDSADATYLEKKVAGAYTQLGSASAVGSVSDVIRLEAEGTTITPLYNGSTTGTPGAQTDAAISSGSAGVCGFGDGTGSRIDDWEGGDLGVATLEVSVSDSVSIAETITRQVVSEIDVSDSVAIAEAITLQIISEIGASDNVAISETASALIASLINVSDSVAVTETVERMLLSFVNATDAITAGDSVNVSIAVAGIFTVAVSDNVSISEAVALQVITEIGASDSVAIAETVTLEVVSEIAVSDSIAIAETMALQTISEISASDSITLADTPSLTTDALGISVSEAIAVAESVNITVVITGVFTVNVSDSITAVEAVARQLISPISVSDSANVSEAIGRELVSFVGVSDAASLAESVSALVDTGIFIAVSDAIGVSEAVALETIALLIVVSQGLTVAESVTVNLPSGIKLDVDGSITLVTNLGVAAVVQTNVSGSTSTR